MQQNGDIHPILSDYKYGKFARKGFEDGKNGMVKGVLKRLQKKEKQSC